MKSLRYTALAALGCFGLLVLGACSRSDDRAQAPADAPTASALAPAPTTVSSNFTTRTVARLINLGADKCLPCRQMVPVRNALSAEYPETLAVSFIDVWAERKAGSQHKVRVIPTQIIQDAEGRELFRHEGYWPKEAILHKMTELGLDLGPPQGSPGV